MRGTLALALFALLVRRIIPAHAGNSYSVQRAKHGTTDHPRACGELPELQPRMVQVAGSSPRMRGTHAPFWVNRVKDRIIPAHAGNSERGIES